MDAKVSWKGELAFTGTSGRGYSLSLEFIACLWR